MVGVQIKLSVVFKWFMNSWEQNQPDGTLYDCTLYHSTLGKIKDFAEAPWVALPQDGVVYLFYLRLKVNLQERTSKQDVVNVYFIVW